MNNQPITLIDLQQQDLQIRERIELIDNELAKQQEYYETKQDLLNQLTQIKKPEKIVKVEEPKKVRKMNNNNPLLPSFVNQPIRFN